MRAPRVYQVWRGKNKFVCGGRLIFGPDYRSFLISVCLITIPSLLFLSVVAPSVARMTKGGFGVTIAGSFLLAWDLMLLLLTAGRDPGIIPRNPLPPVEFDIETGTPRTRPPRTKEVTISGRPVKVKYCDTCNHYRPPRCSHCSICDNCVERFDHHCPWIGQCIGRRNYRYFFLFVLSTVLLCAYVFSLSAINIKLLMFENPHKRLSIFGAFGKGVSGPISVILMCYTFIAVWFVGGLTAFHTYLMWTNQTTYENFRYRYDARTNPANRGGPQNIKEILCSPTPPSWNNFRARELDPRALVGVEVNGEVPGLKGVPASSEAADAIGSGHGNGSSFLPGGDRWGREQATYLGVTAPTYRGVTAPMQAERVSPIGNGAMEQDNLLSSGAANGWPAQGTPDRI